MLDKNYTSLACRYCIDVFGMPLKSTVFSKGEACPYTRQESEYLDFEDSAVKVQTLQPEKN